MASTVSARYDVGSVARRRNRDAEVGRFVGVIGGAREERHAGGLDGRAHATPAAERERRPQSVLVPVWVGGSQDGRLVEPDRVCTRSAARSPHRRERLDRGM